MNIILSEVGNTTQPLHGIFSKINPLSEIPSSD